MANFNVESFKGQVRDLSRANRFEIVLSRAGELQFYAHATSVPANTVEAMDVSYQGRILKFPGDRTNPDWTITVYGQESFEIYNNLEQWLAELNHPQANIGINAPAAKADGVIRQLGRTGDVLKEWKIVGCFPTELGEISLDWSSNNTPTEFTVTLASDYIISAAVA